MQELNPELASPPTLSCEDILVRKLARAVVCSVSSQLLILLIYIILANANFLNASLWITSILNTFTHLSTWIFFVIFSFIIFAQCLICAKDYVLMSSYCSTRFQQFLHIFSIHNFTLLSLHVIVGGAFVWQNLSLVDGELKHLTTECDGGTCLVQGTFFLIVSGIWMGLYYFLKVYVSSRHLVFPIIQQKKFLQFRTNITALFKESMKLTVWPTLYFALFYNFWGYQLESRFMSIFGLKQTFGPTSLLIYVYCWWFATLYFYSMNLMRFFFHLFLTEPVQFMLIKENTCILTLQEALSISSLPIIQNLACLDLYLLSRWSPLRRQFLFTLSQPGGHPHNWNSLIDNVLRLLKEYTELLKKSTESPQPQKPVMQPEITPFAPLRVQSPDCHLKFRNLRNMSVQEDCCFDFIDMKSAQERKPYFGSFTSKIQEFMNKLTNFLKILLGINFLFGELPQVNVQKCLGNGQIVIWASQGLSELAAASLNEDRYGIVQKDLPEIITTLVQLKQTLDKLNKVPVLTRKVATLNDFNYKMKNAVIAGVKRSLFSLCLNFGDYFHDLPLSKEVFHYLQVNIMLKNCN